MLFILGTTLILYSAFPDYYYSAFQVQSHFKLQQQQVLAVQMIILDGLLHIMMITILLQMELTI